jgi:putative DNA primase/helicase
MSRRSLYTDADEFIFDGKRPIVLNGIDELASRADLLDRSVLLELPVIRKYVSEEEFWRKFDAAYPQILGALLDVAAGTLQRLPKVKLADQPRMADFALLGTAVESVLGLPSGTFRRAYSLNRQNAMAVALEACPYASQISELATKSWQGSATKLLKKLDGMVDEETRRRRSWPKSPKALSGMLRRLSPALRTAGVEIEFDRDNTRNRNKTILIRQLRSKAKQS